MQPRVYDNDNKIYVDVDLRHTKTSKKIPQVVYYEKRNGQIIAIEVLRVLEERSAAAHKAGGVGTLYKCLLNGRTQPTSLYLEHATDRWFVERK